MEESAVARSKELEDNTSFTLSNHYEERIKFHMLMLNYYLNEKNDRMGTITRVISWCINRN